ncbi:Nif3-like dinuclear metal center hexameric protein [Thermoactinomyces sp. CICC 10523]|uniref:Nif3-like dinuclear metal center hexameric protein n=1 Tax=Thermoactinomyces sp. CICC 10523 TaxID=2767428 RepID=UPI0018DD9E10|nr:Nif3-like dinuclear metal center hexameric protein [Thermoactinomyces sp. CICC 10523]MBH8597414.1 Nif3-like dinuclear metal center hexameric protein [Thermoactinomyces sp. CICC 10523]
MSIRGVELIKAMNHYAPPRLAVDNDRIGLQVGDPEAEVKGVLVTLDVNEEVVDEAIQRNANWIIAHHAVIFHPLKAVRTDQPAGRMIAKLLKHDINVYVAHTNLDAADEGVNVVLAEKLGLQHLRVLISYREEKLKKLVVTVPVSHHEQVLDAVCAAGAGWIGKYSHCTFNVEGTGTFMPREGTSPFIGQQGELEKVQEIRLETILPDHLQEQVIQAMLAAHPYEEVAYDLYPLELKGKKLGFGRIGQLPEQTTLLDFARTVKQSYQLDGLKAVGEWSNPVRRVAILGGSGGRYIHEAKQAGADVYITGDIDYHTAQEAEAIGLNLLDVGHHVEHHVVDRVRHILQRQLGEAVSVFASRVNTNPFRFIGG